MSHFKNANLKYISTEGSKIPNVEFNINGGSLEEAHFSYNTRSVSLRNFNLLKTITFEEGLKEILFEIISVISICFWSKEKKENQVNNFNYNYT